MNCMKKDGLMAKEIFISHLPCHRFLMGQQVIQIPLLVGVSESCVVDCRLRRGFSASRVDEKCGQAASLRPLLKPEVRTWRAC